MSVPGRLSPLTPEDPREIGTFRLRARLDAGGMGRVYLGYSPAGRAVAVKLVRPDLAQSPAFRARFRHEVAAASRVSGAYTAPVIDSGPDDEIPWLATVYVPGPSLADAVSEVGPLTADALWKLAGGLAEALASIHACNVVHRDLKPSNVLLAADGPRVIDFGISRAAERAALTSVGAIMGTPEFMSPEQAAGAPAGQASDIFSLGGVLVFAATGREPFGGAGGDTPALLHRVAHEIPDLGGTSGQLRDLIAGCMAADPSARPAAAEVVALIVAAGPGKATAAEHNASPGFWPAPLDALIQSYADRTAATAWPAQSSPDGSANAQAARTVMSSREKPPARKAHQNRPLGGGTKPAGRFPRILLAATLAAVLLAVGVPVTISLLSKAPRSASGAGGTTSSRPATAPDSPSTATASSATAMPVPEHLGAPDFYGYCMSTGHGTAQLAADNADGWTCTKTPAVSVNVNKACAWTYRRPLSQTTTYMEVFTDPKSWECWAVHRQLKPPNWDGYCMLQHFGHVYLAENNVFGWLCRNNSGMWKDSVCQWTNNVSSPVLGRFEDYYNPYSWECWV